MKSLRLISLLVLAFSLPAHAQQNADRDANLGDRAAWVVDSRHTNILIADWSLCTDCGKATYQICRDFMGDTDSNMDRGHVFLEVDGKQFTRKTPGGKTVPLTLQPNSCAYVSGIRIGLSYAPPTGGQPVYRTFGSYKPVVDTNNAGPLPKFLWAMWGDPKDPEAVRYATQLLSLNAPALIRFCTNLPANTSYDSAIRVRITVDDTKQYIQPFPPFSCIDMLSETGRLSAAYVPVKRGSAVNFNASGSVMFFAADLPTFEQLTGPRAIE